MIRGSLVAIVTPMHDDGSIDFDTYRKLIEWHISQGTDAIVSMGTTGESPTLDFDEHNEVVECAVKTAAGMRRLPGNASSPSRPRRPGLPVPCRHAAPPASRL